MDSTSTSDTQVNPSSPAKKIKLILYKPKKPFPISFELCSTVRPVHKSGDTQGVFTLYNNKIARYYLLKLNITDLQLEESHYLVITNNENL